MSNFLTSLTDEVQSYLQWTASTTGALFQLITIFGKLLLQSFTFFVQAVHVCFVSLLEGTWIFLHEFVLFLGDISDFTNSLLKLLNSTGEQATQLVLNLSNFIQNTWNQLHGSTFALIDCTLYLLLSILLNAKALLILVGNSTFFLLQLGPNLVVSIFSLITSFTFLCAETVWVNVIKLSHHSQALLQGFHGELVDIPPTSWIGILFALIISVVFRFYFKSISWIFYWQLAKTFIGKWLRLPRLERSSVLTASTVSSFKCGKSELDDHSNSRHLLRQLEQEREDKLCVVCHDHFKCVILLPCRHFCLCQSCVQVIQQTDPSCPLCRHYVIDSLKVYC